MLLKNTKKEILDSLDIKILNHYIYIEDLDKRVELIKKNLQKLFEIFKGNKFLLNELSVLVNVFNHLDIEWIIELINRNETILDVEFGNDKVLEIKGVEIVEKINLIFYYVIENSLDDIKPNILKTKDMEKMMCIALLDSDIQKLFKLGFYGQDIKQAIDYATEYLRLNKSNNQLEIISVSRFVADGLSRQFTRIRDRYDDGIDDAIEVSGTIEGKEVDMEALLKYVSGQYGTTISIENEKEIVEQIEVVSNAIEINKDKPFTIQWLS